MGWPQQFGWRGWFWPVLLATTICVASGRGEVAAPAVIGFDKLAHFAVFGLLATLVVRNGGATRGWGWATVALVSAFGALDEFHQSFTAGRSVQAADWVADTLGAAVAVWAYSNWAWYRGLLERGVKRRVEKSGVMSPNPNVV